MQLTKSKKIFIYLFLLCILGSINNIKINNTNLTKIKIIDIEGLDEFENDIILKELNKINMGNIFFINLDEIKKIFDKNTLVENYKIIKVYPSKLDIKIQKTQFLARINQKNKIYLVGSNGKLSEEKYSHLKLPFIFGNPELKEFLKLKKILSRSKFLYEDIKNLYFFPSTRWDLEFKNNLILKLPENNIQYMLDIIFELLENKNLEKIKIVDARIKDQIIIND